MSLLFQNATLLSMDATYGTTPFTGDLLVEGDSIAAIGTDIPLPPETRVIDASGKLVMPGLVNAHLHSSETFFKGRYQGTPLEVWMLYSYPILMKGPISERLLYLRSLLTAMESLKAGVTTLVDDFFDPPGFDVGRLKRVYDAYDDAGIRANVSHCVIDKHVFDTMPYLREIMPTDLQAGGRGPIDHHRRLHGLLQGCICFRAWPRRTARLYGLSVRAATLLGGDDAGLRGAGT